MDFQNRPGVKTGGGGLASSSETNKQRRERLHQLALQTIDLKKDPYFMKNHIGTFECKLCLTLHHNECSYMAHTQGKKHQANLSKRAQKEMRDLITYPSYDKPRPEIRKFTKIGRPGYSVTKQKCSETGQQSLLIRIDYVQIVDGVLPRHRFMSAFEQKVEAPDYKWQYLIFAAEPYENIAFKIPSRQIDNIWHKWNVNSKQFFIQLSFRMETLQINDSFMKMSPMMQKFSITNPILNSFSQFTNIRPPPPPANFFK